MGDVIMRKEYQEELNKLKEKMEKAKILAERLPIFEEKIIKGKMAYDSEWLNFGDRYKKIPLDWGINRGLYKDKTSREITNYEYEIGKPYEKFLFSIYVNQLSLFGENDRFEIYEALKDVKIFFIDKMNTHFYIEDEHIEHFLDTLNDWYLEQKAGLVEYRRKKKISELKKELSKLEQQEVS